jgi:hypothetical protein
MPLRDAFGHFVRGAEAAPVEVIEPASAPLAAVQRFAEAQAASSRHQEEMAGLRDRITGAGEARRAALADENWARVAEIDAEIGALRTRLEGGAIRDRALGAAITAAEEEIGRAEREVLRGRLNAAYARLCASAFMLAQSIDAVRNLQGQLNPETMLPDWNFVNGWLVAGWVRQHLEATGQAPPQAA